METSNTKIYIPSFLFDKDLSIHAFALAVALYNSIDTSTVKFTRKCPLHTAFEELKNKEIATKEGVRIFGTATHDYLSISRQTYNSLDSNLLKLYATMCFDADPDTRKLSASHTELGRLTGTKENAVQIKIKQLRTLGLITHRGYTSSQKSIYLINEPYTIKLFNSDETNEWWDCTIVIPNNLFKINLSPQAFAIAVALYNYNFVVEQTHESRFSVIYSPKHLARLCRLSTDATRKHIGELSKTDIITKTVKIKNGYIRYYLKKFEQLPENYITLAKKSYDVIEPELLQTYLTIRYCNDNDMSIDALDYKPIGLRKLIIGGYISPNSESYTILK